MCFMYCGKAACKSTQFLCRPAPTSFIHFVIFDLSFSLLFISSVSLVFLTSPVGTLSILILLNLLDHLVYPVTQVSFECLKGFCIKSAIHVFMPFHLWNALTHSLEIPV
ncbi:hypothetical protein AX774_g4833 [Zancudomyces culisetae]|uniref:Uncharacterized protein n=1 Tax=Zancudomyces culisetae TaxID=1213189 RepID=A0A1R1PL64_ZANCU|nr:hypothetical protein AX774_g4833 [Zancudomyces culisetae]|eukprot:OMH81710.1 hypothetical protein AX774_g4833 [Zancudomyces culisetae]